MNGSLYLASAASVGAQESLLGGLIAAFIIIYIALIIFSLATVVILYISLWFIAQKAGRPGWIGIIPVLNQLLLLDLAGKPWWWIFFILMVPVANIVFLALTYVDLVRAFGKSGGWAAGLIFLPFVFFPILALSKNIHYQRPADFPPAWLTL